MSEAAAEGPAKLDLAGEPDFRLGGLEVSPSAGRVRSAAADQRVEPRVMEVLLVLAKSEGRTVSRDRLIEACWDGRIVSDDAIARIIAKVRTLSRLAEPAAFEVETIPKVGFRLTSSAAREPVAPSLPPPVRSGWRRPGALASLGAGLVLLIAVAGLLAWRPWEAPFGQNGRVEVIRFEARQADPEVQRVAAGAAEAVMGVLTRGGIDTVSRIGEPDDGTGSDAELRVTGSVSRDDDGLALTTQVLDRRSGMVLLTNRFVRDAGPGGLAEQGAQGLASALRCTLEDRRRSGRRMEPQVLSLYLNACDAVSREGNMVRMLETTRRLVAAEPDLAIVQALYAIAQGNSAQYIGGEGPEVEALRRGARASALRAIEMDPGNAKAYLGLAQSYPAGSHWLEREAALEKAHALDPNMAPARMSYIGLLREVGRLREAKLIADRLLSSSDPRGNAGALIPAAFLAAQSGEMGNVTEYLDQLDRIDPELGRGIRWQAVHFWEDPSEGLAQLEAMGPRRINAQAYACARRYLRELPQRMASRARGLPPECDRIPPERRIRMLARQGDLDGAYAELAQLSADERVVPGNAFLFFTEMKAFRADPRFPALVRKMGLADYWARSGKWPDFCREPALSYDCRSLAAQTR